MILLPDVCVLFAAHRLDHPQHRPARDVLDRLGGRGFALCPHTVNGFLRLATHPAVADPPTPMPVALQAVQEWRDRPEARLLADTPATWAAFASLCRAQNAAGNAVYDLHLAALAIGHRCLLVSSDQGFSRVPGLSWKPPAALA